MKLSALFLLAVLLCTRINAQVVSQALLSLPAKTGYVEYDNLAILRTLANYSTLRQQFAGKPLEDAQATLSQLGIDESQVREIVSGTSAKAYYGFAAGTFNSQTAAALGRRKGFATKLREHEVFCPPSKSCAVFLEDSLAAFGAAADLKDLLNVRDGFNPSLNSNRNLVALLNNTDRRSPVRGVLVGGQLNAAVSDLLNDLTGWKKDWSTLSANMSAIAYSVGFDKALAGNAHVAATVECTSKTAAAVLVQMLSAVGSFQSAGASPAKPGKSAPAMPFQNLQVSSAGNTVSFKADTPVPTASTNPR